jgi:hypothetical protein
MECGTRRQARRHLVAELGMSKSGGTVSQLGYSTSVACHGSPRKQQQPSLTRCIKSPNLFKRTSMKIAFRPTNTIYQQLSQKPKDNNPSGVYQLRCNTCNRAYVGQSGRNIYQQDTTNISGTYGAITPYQHMLHTFCKADTSMAQQKKPSNV